MLSVLYVTFSQSTLRIHVFFRMHIFVPSLLPTKMVQLKTAILETLYFVRKYKYLRTALINVYIYDKIRRKWILRSLLLLSYKTAIVTFRGLLL
jgi:hypothetical protein